MSIVLNNVAVFLGSSAGSKPIYREAAARLGATFARRSIGLVYGGADVGLMKVIADAVLDGGGRVSGILPSALADREIAHKRLTALEIVDGMHPRKAAMYARSDAFIALPGGYGTLDELFEVLTWRQIELHHKPVGVLDVGGYYTPLLAFLDRIVEEGLLRAEYRAHLIADDDPDRLLDRLSASAR